MSQEPTTSSSKGNILVVDDTPANLNLLTQMLSKQGYKVRVAPNGRLALRSVESIPPDLILLDIMMPDMDGYQVCQELKASSQTKDIPVIFISALHDVIDKVKAFSVGGVDYISKPFQVEEVLVRIENQLKIGRLSKQLCEENARLAEEVRVRQQAEESLRSRAVKLRHQNIVLMELASNQGLHQGDLKDALKEITEATAHNIGVERVSVWLYDATGTKLQCLDLYEQTLHQHSQGIELAAVDYPAYFQALTQEHLIVADDAHVDPRTQEFSESYLTPLDITSMLDAPIRLRGQTMGVLCNEQVGATHHWTSEDQNFARSVADLISLVLEAQERKRSETRYRELFEGSVDGIAVVDIEGRFIDCNASYQKMLGYSLEELQQKSFWEITPVRWHEWEAQIVEQQVIARGYSDTFEKEYIRKDGTVFPVELTVYCQRTNERQPERIWAIARDISDAHQQAAQYQQAVSLSEAARSAAARSAAALTESEKKYRALVEASQDMIWSMDAEGRYTFVNQAVKQIYGYDPEEMLGRPFTDFEPSEQITKDLEVFQRLLKGEPLFQYETTHLTKDGRTIQMMLNAIALRDEQGNVVGTTGTACDITERKRIEEALRESEQRWQLAIAANNDGIWDFNLKTKKTFRSARWKEMLGYSDSEIGDSLEEWSSRIHPDDVDRVIAATRDYHNQRSPQFAMEYRLRCKDGSYKWILSRSQALWDEDGKPLRVVGSNADITERKIAEEKLRAGEASLAAAQRIAHIGSWEFDVSTQQFTWSEEHFRLFGFDPTQAEPTYAKFLEKIHPDDQALFQNTVDQILTSGTGYELEFRIVLGDGQVRHIEGRAEAVVNQAGQVIRLFGTVMDITQRKQAEAAISESERRYRYLVETSQDVIWSVDAQGYFTFVNQAVKQIYGYEPEEVIGHHFMDFLSPKQMANDLEVFQSVLNGESLFQYETTHLTKDNSRIHLLFNAIAQRDEWGQVIGTTGTASNITERKRVEEEIRHTQAFLNSIIENIPDMIFVKDAKELRFVSFNKAGEKLLGYAKEELIGKNDYDFFPQEEADFFTAKDREVLLEGKLLDIPEEPLPTRDKGIRTLHTKKIPIFDESEQPQYLLGISEDITEHKQAELALQESQRRYQALAEASPVCIFHTDELGNCFYVNQRWSEITGLSLEDALGSGWTSTIHPDDSDRVLAEWSLAATDRVPFKSEYRLVRPDNQIIWVIGQALAEVGDNGEIQGFVGTITDISDRKQTEFALQQQILREQLVGAMQERIRQSLNLEEVLKTAVEEVREFLQTDRAIIYRFRPDWSGDVVVESVGEGWVKTLSLNIHDPCFGENMVTPYRQGRISTVEDLYKTGAQQCYIDLLETYQVRANVVVPILLQAGDQHRVGEEEAQGESLQGENLGKDTSHASSTLWGLLIAHHCRSPRHWQESEIESLRQLSVQLAIAIQQSTLFEQAQAEIAERKRAESALEEAKEAAEVANRAKSQFLANMSHELRTPLNAILGFTQVMNRDASLSSEQRDYLGIIMRSGEHLLELINDILEMSKIEAGRITFNENTFNLYRLLDNIEEMFQLKAQSNGLQLVFERTLDVPQYIQTDEGKLRQVLINLLGNAIKFTESGRLTVHVVKKLNVERLKVETSNLQPPNLQPSNLQPPNLQPPNLQPSNLQPSNLQPPNLQPSNLQPSNLQPPNLQPPNLQPPNLQPATQEQPVTLTFEVSDTGPGIAPEEIDSLFEAFTQSATGRKSQKGTGLGLPISRSFVQLMGGNMTVESTLGEGSTFKFDVPIKLAQATDIQTQQQTGRVIGLAPDQRAYRILVVEDKRDSRQLLVKLLTVVGFQVREAENGEQAVAMWSSWQPHLIWMDMRMPVMDGYEATKQIKSHLKGQATVIIALTASAFEEQRAVILSAGCDDFVRKPFREEVLFAKMAEHLGVRYSYEEQDQPTSAQSRERVEALTPEALAVMPKEWLAQLHSAAEACNDEEILSLIEQIPEEHGNLKVALANLVDNFRLDIIIDLTQAAANE